MTVGIIHPLLRWFLDVLVPGTGERRATTRRTHPHRPESRRFQAPTPSLSPHRSPYGHHTPLDGHANALVRPYLAPQERHRTQQRRRRLALVLAADFGIDLDRHVIGAEGRAA
ncbi:hypothetical protein [Streptomyces sp. NPDC058755]|uniref:hypothetical protein n=1 Tax=Streptomyces sp. NPDC058755 TaxID=3346624 RepID=UPI0036C4AA28